jgi:predicted DCC family thiol-disulfide oxidoreductase YuxK
MTAIFCDLNSVPTEYTDNKAGIAAWLFYDGECRLCRESAGRVESILARRRIRLCTLQSSEAPQRLGLSGRALLREIRLLLADGRNLGGADAVMEISRRIWWAWPLWLFSRVPGVRPLLHAVYRVIATNRYCIGGVCNIPRRHAWRDWLPLLVLPVMADALHNALPAWMFMWLLALAIFLGCKWLTLCRARTSPTRGAAFAYLFAWPGMDAESFLAGTAIDRPRLGQWLIAGAETLAGAILLWFAARGSLGFSPLFTGWLGMAGIVMMLHFGFFHLLSLGWLVAGRCVKPLMRSPLLATSLADFWGNRWNTAFHALANEFVFRRLARPLGVAWATFVVFLISGLVHDLVISVPASGGFGLPTGYFLLQGAGVLFERSKVGRGLGFARGWRGWLFMLTVTAAPAFWLFHPPFVHHVILPMLQALGGTGNTP